ncbi:hypothetical protein Terro_3188 [Terriglobus roseus DSM 18391]|uniref:PH domain-containing protein n=1 Tax=Terriglobus roseus (strain DSM 18391 / NRRL B-41598 / KBS 63) TaxID=926566 RepID=I3ZJJ2_TERRK|nr:hypothetical protein Terro_3188 [Terriglobus roseus DSM 18391]
MLARNQITFGSRPKILFVRISQCAVALCFIAVLFGGQSVASWFLMGIPLLLFETYMSGMVLARLSEDGLAYKRLGTWKEVRWTEFAYGGVSPVGTIRLKLPNQPIWRRYLLLLVPDPPLEDQEASLPGARRFCEIMEPPSGRTN